MTIGLPEALRLATQLDEGLVGRRIAEIAASPDCDKLARMGFMEPDRLAELVRRRVEGAHSCADWIYIVLSGDRQLVLGLGMGASLALVPEETRPPKHHLLLTFDDRTSLAIRVHGMGFMKALSREQVRQDPYAGTFGILAYGDDRFTLEAFSELLSDKEQMIKFVLLGTSKWISGFGNGYLQEILRDARIHPARKASGLDEAERERLFDAIVATMQEAVRLGGDARQKDLFGKPGGFVRTLGSKALGKPCGVCGAPIDRVSLFGSYTYYCPNCQPTPSTEQRGKTTAKLWFLEQRRRRQE